MTTSNLESKVLEKLRDMMDKKISPGEMLDRSFTWPSQDDSDESLLVSVSVRCRSVVPSMGSTEARIERRKLSVRFGDK